MRYVYEETVIERTITSHMDKTMLKLNASLYDCGTVHAPSLMTVLECSVHQGREGRLC